MFIHSIGPIGREILIFRKDPFIFVVKDYVSWEFKSSYRSNDCSARIELKRLKIVLFKGYRMMCVFIQLDQNQAR